jgi:hypothetical protein
VTLVRHLPETDKSAYFGLPPNIDVTVQYNESVYLSARLKGKTDLISAFENVIFNCLLSIQLFIRLQFSLQLGT